MMMGWYSLRVISGKEKSIETSIMREVDENDISGEIEEVFVPFEKVVEVRNNKKRIKEKMFFPGYILIKMNLTANTKYIVENTPGVLSFVGPKGKAPVPLRDNEIMRIFGEVERKEGMEIIKVPFNKGDAIKVISGPFIDFTGLVESVNEDKQKVKVSVSIFGRPTPIELDFFQVELEK
jgi:transcriptional antiterminator NusG